MSTTPPSGPPSNPPAGPPPSEPPPGGEFLEHGGGSPLRPERSSGGSRKPLILGAAGVAALAVVGGGAWAAMSFLSTGSQPAEALPAGTIGYLSVDLDPSGGQKIEALQTLNKFPAFEDQVGISADDDLKMEIVQYILDEGECDVDYDDTIGSWLSERFAVAAVDLGGEEPVPVVVGQVSDADAADKGIETLVAECGDEGDGAWAFSGDWVLMGEDQDTVDSVVEATGEGTLADDADFSSWTSETGDSGVMSGYVSPEAGRFLAQGADPFSDPAGVGSEAEALGAAMEDFGGAAMTMRFADGGLEIETAADTSAFSVGSLGSSSAGADVVKTLPEDTALAMGVGFEDGWFDEMVDYVASFGGLPGVDIDQAISEIEAETGLDLPEDAETLMGSSMALAVGGDLDPEALFASADGSGIPIAMKVQGDPAEIETVMEKIRSNPAAAEVAMFLGSDTEGDAVAMGPSNSYREEVLGDGGLGDSEKFKSVVPDADEASSVLYVNFDAGDGWLSELAQGDPTITENLDPLSAFGIAGWMDGDTGHSVFRLTTD